MPNSEHTLKRIQQLTVFAGVLAVALVVSVLGLALYESHARSSERAERIALINASNLAFCKEIELLKLGERKRALESWKSLPATVRLLHLKLTPEIRRTAHRNLVEALKRYEPDACPRLPPL